MVSIRPVDPSKVGLNAKEISLLCRVRTMAGKNGLGLLDQELPAAVTLIDLGLVQETAGNPNGRGHYVAITEAGREVLRSLYG